MFVEVLVVVVGLMLGLQLNDWAKARQDRALVNTYYQQLIIDLEDDVRTGEYAEAYADPLDESAAIVERVLADDAVDALDDATLIRSVVRAGYSFRPLSTRQTYDELINTGSLALIHDVEVKRAIGRYYAFMERGRQWDPLVQHEQMNYRDAIRGLLTPEQMRWVRGNLRDVHTPPPPLDRQKLLSGVRAREDIYGAVSAMAAVQERFRSQGQQMAEVAQALIDTLKAALSDGRSQ